MTFATRHASAPADIRLMNTIACVIGALAMLVLAAFVMVWVARQPIFAIRGISVDGDVTRNSVATIRANAVPRLTGNFFTLDLGSARRAFETVPWVRQAVLHRVWPNRLQVRLEEHRAAALWVATGSEDESDTLVNSFGEVFEVNLGDVEDDALPTLRGPEGESAHMLAFWARLKQVFAPLDVGIDTLELSGRGSWRAKLDSGAEIELGRGSDNEVAERTQRFVSTVTQVTQRFQRPLEYADLRHNEGYAVRLKGISTTLDPTGKPARK